LATSSPQNPDAHFDVTCPGCGRSYRLPRKAAGRRGTCRKCGHRFPIPEPAAIVAEPALGSLPALSPRAARTRELLQLLDDSIVFPKQRVTLAHRLAALAVAGLMVLLPALYVAFVAGVGWLTCWHAKYDWVWVKELAGYASVIGAALYAGLALGGALWTFSLIQSLFTSLSVPDEGNRISRLDEPALFAFVDRLADKVGCPRPDVIRLNLDVNASAYYETTLFGLRRRAFTLTLGLPLIGGFNLSQLAGVIAHELGHFGQRGSSFLDRFIKRINLWFVDAVSRPSLLDELIESLTGEGWHYLASIVGLVLKLLVLLGRYVLFGLMHVGLFASASLMRRMEFDADCYEVGVIGSADFEASCERLVALIVAHGLAFRHAFGSMDCRILPSDLVAFISELADRAPKVRKRARKLIANEKRSWIASHPTWRDRIANAQRLDLPKLFTSSVAASELFESFEMRSRAITAILYTQWYGRKLTPDAVRPAHEAVEMYLALDAAGGFSLPAGAR
jgi:Zn-dependent protease with chaperone function